MVAQAQDSTIEGVRRALAEVSSFLHKMDESPREFTSAVVFPVVAIKQQLALHRLTDMVEVMMERLDRLESRR
jgi:hypothetical protein